MKKIHLYATLILNIVLIVALFNQLTIQSLLLIIPIIICTTVVQVLEHMSYRKEIKHFERIINEYIQVNINYERQAHTLNLALSNALTNSKTYSYALNGYTIKE